MEQQFHVLINKSNTYNLNPTHRPKKQKQLLSLAFTALWFSGCTYKSTSGFLPVFLGAREKWIHVVKSFFISIIHLYNRLSMRPQSAPSARYKVVRIAERLMGQWLSSVGLQQQFGQLLCSFNVDCTKWMISHLDLYITLANVDEVVGFAKWVQVWGIQSRHPPTLQHVPPLICQVEEEQHPLLHPLSPVPHLLYCTPSRTL